MPTAAHPIPDHIPPHLVGSFNLYTSPGMAPTPLGDPHAAVSVLHAGPPIFYAPNNTRNGEGTWMAITAELQRKVLQDGVTFSSNRRLFASALGEDWPLIPLEIDPPEHGVWRSLLNPLLSPKRVIALEPAVRARASELIEGIKARGNSCDVMDDFCYPFAVSIFLQFLGISTEMLPTFVELGDGPDPRHPGKAHRRGAQLHRLSRRSARTAPPRADRRFHVVRHPGRSRRAQDDAA